MSTAGSQCSFGYGIKNDNYIAMTQGVESFLGNLGLLQYFDIFVIKGFDSEDDISNLNQSDLDAMLISDVDHRRIILSAAKHFKPSDEYRVLEWLRSNGLEHYFVNFIQSELDCLEKIAQQNLPDGQLYDELEITLPGHIRRLERAVNRLRKKQRVDEGERLDVGAERPLAYGRWAKPDCLQDAKFDFLVVDAKVCSTRDPSVSQTLEFMVDSGSDVTTIREEVLERLNLELLGRIHSKGVHGSKTTNLYKAVLCIGGQQLVIEVMGETYDSLGSRVVRHFRHFIDGSRHLWLKGDYSDPDMLPVQTIHHPSTSQEQTVPSLVSYPTSSSTSSSTHPATSSSYQSTSESLTSSSQHTDHSDSQQLGSQQSQLITESQQSQVFTESQQSQCEEESHGSHLNIASGQQGLFTTQEASQERDSESDDLELDESL